MVAESINSNRPNGVTDEPNHALHCGIGSWDLLGWPASESGPLCHGDAAHGRGDRRRRGLMLPRFNRTRFCAP